MSPDERPIDVLAGPATRVEPSLVTIKALLDTVRVVGKRVFNADRTGFGMRRKGSVGKFFGPDDIDKLRPIQTTDLFHRVLGVKMVTAGFDHVIRMRGTFKGDCTPNIFVDGFRYRDFNANDIDNMVHPDAVAGVEVYVSPTSVPSEYLSPFSNCGDDPDLDQTLTSLAGYACCH